MKIDKFNTKTFINKANLYGKTKTPFLYIIDFEMTKPLIFKIDALNPTQIIYVFNNFSNINIDDKFLQKNKKLSLEKKPINFETYKKAYNIVKQNINAGNTYLLNLTFPSEIKINLSLEEIFYKSKAKYKLYIKNKFVFFSPEIFIKIKDGIISSYPMKGTIDASIPNAERIIINDKKETAEHNTIVDLIRNDLNMVAKQVSVERFRYIEKLVTDEKNLLQVSSKIIGQLPKNYMENIGNIIHKLLPAGSISGAPKVRTCEIISKAENYQRGYYTGIAGIFDGQNIDSCVIIRYIEKQNNKFVYKSGGGITSFSNLTSEYNELIDKIYLPIKNYF